MKVYQSNEIKNIALVGGAKAGKTTLAEAMLFEGKVINRKGTIDDKNTVSDYREIELDKHGSVYTSLLYTEFNGKKINILDTPGTADYVGEVVAALNVVDTAVLLVNANEGLDVGVELGWRNTSKIGNPVMFVVNQLDHEKANFEEAVNELQAAFGEKVTLAQYPLNAGLDFDTIIDVLLMKQLKFAKTGGLPQVSDIPASEMAKAEALRSKIIEAAAEGSEELMEKYFENDTLEIEDIRLGIRLGMPKRTFFPVFCTAAKSGVGVSRMMEFMTLALPEPSACPRKTENGGELNSDSTKPASLFIFKTANEQHIGEVSYFRVYAGQIAEGMDMINGASGNKERLSQILVCYGKNREKVEKMMAGDIGATIKLKEGLANTTLNAPNAKDTIIEKIVYPDPIFFTAVKAVNSTDDEKVGSVLHEMHKTDPSLRAEYSRELRQLVVSGMGEQHINLAKWYFDKVHKVEIKFMPTRIPYRETITKAANADYRHKKQSGGSGQFGEVHMKIQPYFEGYTDPTEFPVRGKETHEMPWGGRLIYCNCIVGGAIDARFMPAILKGIMEKMERGPLTGSYARDIIVYIYDGKMHPVDSNEISFKLAGRNAFSEAFKNAGPKILEPIYDVEVNVPEDMMGNVMTDLQGRRAVIMGMDSAGGGRQLIKARIPLAEMNRYSTALSSLTSGRGLYGMKFSEYAQVPSDVQNELLKKYEEEQEEEN